MRDHFYQFIPGAGRESSNNFRDDDTHRLESWKTTAAARCGLISPRRSSRVHQTFLGNRYSANPTIGGLSWPKSPPQLVRDVIIDACTFLISRSAKLRGSLISCNYTRKWLSPPPSSPLVWPKLIPRLVIKTDQSTATNITALMSWLITLACTLNVMVVLDDYDGCGSGREIQYYFRRFTRQWWFDVLIKLRSSAF